MVKKISDFYRTETFITVFTRARHQILILSLLNAIHVFPQHFPNIYLNTILPSMPRSSEWFLPLRLYNQIFVRISHLLYALYIPRLSYPP
jgi:hypothetical protein